MRKFRFWFRLRGLNRPFVLPIYPPGRLPKVTKKRNVQNVGPWRAVVQSWRFEYPNGQVDELHLQRPVRRVIYDEGVTPCE